MDRLTRAFGPRIGRGVVGCASLALASVFLLATALTTGKASGIILLTLGFGVLDCMLPAAWALSLDLGGPFAAQFPAP